LRSIEVEEGDLWQSGLSGQPYISPMIWESNAEWKEFVLDLLENDPECDPFWEQVRMEATASLGPEPEAGPQLYQAILSQCSLVEAIVTVIANELETVLVKSTELRNLFLNTLTPEDHDLIASDIVAASSRSPSIGTAIMAIMFQTGLHALVCYRVGHRLWQADRKGLAYYLQSSVSRRYSADIHPACQMGSGIYLSTTAGVVIGETAVVGNDVSILQGVTLGGTGKEAGDRHPKVSNGVILREGASVLGNIRVGDGAVITAKSIVTKPVPPLAIMTGVPAKIMGYRKLDESDFTDDLNRHLALKYLEEWKEFLPNPEDGAAL
jgi:serine O-acetyltransferase